MDVLSNSKILQQINVKIYPSCILCWDSKSGPGIRTNAAILILNNKFCVSFNYFY